MWHWPTLGIELIVPPSIASVFDTHRQRFFQKERGGLLFVDLRDPRGLLLASASPPHPADRAGWFELVIDEHRGRAEIEHANAKGLRLIGYWHTHPQNTPELSMADLASFRALAAGNPIDLPLPVAVIVGRSSSKEGIRAWSIRPEGVFLADHRPRPSTVGLACSSGRSALSDQKRP